LFRNPAFDLRNGGDRKKMDTRVWPQGGGREKDGVLCIGQLKEKGRGKSRKWGKFCSGVLDEETKNGVGVLRNK